MHQESRRCLFILLCILNYSILIIYISFTAIARTLRHNQSKAHKHWMDNQLQYSGLYCTSSGVARKPGFASFEGWIGHPLNPVGCLFNTLVEACVVPEDKPRLSHHLDQCSGDPTAAASETTSSASGTTSTSYR